MCNASVAHTCVLNFKLALCPSVSHPQNGRRLTGDDGRQPAGASVTFACDLDYQLNRSATITCKDNGEWNSSVPISFAGNTMTYSLNI